MHSRYHQLTMGSGAMKTNLFTVVYAVAVSSILLTIIYFVQLSNERFVVKGAIFGGFFIIYVAALLMMKSEHIVYTVIGLSFVNVKMVQLYTSSTNIFVIVAFLVLLARYITSGKDARLFYNVKRSHATAPLVLLLCSYTISLLFVNKEMGYALMMYQSILCASLMVWMIVGTINTEQQLRNLNKLLLTVLFLNLVFSILFLVNPQLDVIRAEFLSLYTFGDDESASRVQGLSFRGEAYGEYLMICALWLFTMALRNRSAKGRLIHYVLAICTMIFLILNRSRGANVVFFLGALAVLLTTWSISPMKKIIALTSIVLIFTGTLYAVGIYSKEVSLLDRFYELSDKSQMVGYVPETRYYTWMPAINHARLHNFLGIGPSFEPYVIKGTWGDIVADQASGEDLEYPHNIILLILCTVGVYGLFSYVFLFYRTMCLKARFQALAPYLKSSYSAYLIAFIAFIIEGQKFDGFLRSPDTNLYFIFIIIAILFTCENVKRDTHEPDIAQNTLTSRAGIYD